MQSGTYRDYAIVRNPNCTIASYWWCNTVSKFLRSTEIVINFYISNAYMCLFHNMFL